MENEGNQKGQLKGNYVRLVKMLTQKPLIVTDFEEIIGFCTDETQCGHLVLTDVLHRAFFYSTTERRACERYATWYQVHKDKTGNPITTIFENSQRFDTIIPFLEKPIEYETAVESLEAAVKMANDKGDREVV